PYTALLDDVAACGYAATEIGDGFPRDPAELRAALDARGLSIPSAWCGLGLFQCSLEQDLEHTREICRRLSGIGATFVNLADQGTPERKAFAGRADSPDAPRLSVQHWDQLAERVCRAADTAREFGLRPLFHAHAGTWVETRAELEELLR